MKSTLVLQIESPTGRGGGKGGRKGNWDWYFTLLEGPQPVDASYCSHMHTYSKKNAQHCKSSLKSSLYTGRHKIPQ